MSHIPIPLSVADISQFARALGKQLQPGAPSHLSLLNMVARASGFRNHQHLRAAHAAQARLAQPVVAEVVDFRLVERVLHQFDGAGRMLRWPSRRPVQELCLWALWSVMPAGVHLHERQVNEVLNRHHHFGDAALLRRSLWGLRLVTRNLDGSDYCRVEVRPPPEARTVIAHLKARRDCAA